MMSNIQTVCSMYQTVVEDVINGIRESFLDEGMDEQVLMELKQLWESKLLQSKPTATPPPAPPTAPVPKSFAAHPLAHLLTTQQQASVQQGMTIPAAHNPAPTQVQSGGPPPAHQHHSSQQHLQAHNLQVPGLTFGLGGSQMSGAAQTALMSLSGGAMQAGLYQQLQQLQQQQLPRQQLPQQPFHIHLASRQQITLPDGRVMQFLPPKTEPNQSPMNQSSTLTLRPVDSSDQHVDKKPKLMNQLDGLGDSDSSEIEEDDDDDLDDDEVLPADDEENAQEEEPLNSGDDISDTDPAEVFEVDNVVVCQFDKINRCKNKWKFHLKDGIMTLHGQDYVFQRANGEAEW